MKAIIYYRKSTDRDDKQANSLEHQLENCRRVAVSNSFEVLKEIWESRSAKTEWTRDGFNELIRLCKTWKIDYIVIDEPKRLSRNNIDTSRIIDLLDKEQIKWILWTSREYKADNSRDKFLLQLDLSLSKMDNEDRAKDIKEKMLTCINNTGRFLWKAPFGYKNITIKKWFKDIVINKKEAKIVKEIYNLRLENKAYTTISLIMREKYWNNININITASRIHWLVQKKFYYWIFSWNWKEFIWKHQPIITKEIYDKANNVWKWVHEKKETLENKIKEPRTFYLKWFIQDTSWMKLTSYVQKNITYYAHQYRSSEKVSINEKLLFDKIWDFIKKNYRKNQILTSIDKDIILNLVTKEKLENWTELKNINPKIKILRDKQNKLLDFKLENTINQELYILKNNSIENEIKELLEEKEILKKDDYKVKTQIMLELAWSLYQSYFNANIEWKAYIVRKLMLELSVNNKKELKIVKNDLFKSSKMCNICFGAPEKLNIRTFKKYLSRIDLDELENFYQFTKLLNIT